VPPKNNAPWLAYRAAGLREVASCECRDPDCITNAFTGRYVMALFEIVRPDGVPVPLYFWWSKN
jgi:hypothetical protein